MTYLALLLPLLPLALARTDTSGCILTQILKYSGNTPYLSAAYYVPDTYEICRPLDCGGGRAPPKNIPGCSFYKGDEPFVEITSYLDGYGPNGALSTEAPEPQSTAAAVASQTQAAEAEETSAALSEGPTTVIAASSAVATSPSTLITSPAVFSSVVVSTSIPSPIPSPPPSNAAGTVQKNVGLLIGALAGFVALY